MKVKRYVAANLQEAMARVRQDLGRDAIILHTQKIQVGGFWGLFGKTMVEVTAATDDDHVTSGQVAAAQPRAAAPPAAPVPAASAAAPPAQAGPPQLYQAASSPAAPPPPPQPQPDLSVLQSEINTVKEMMRQLMQRPLPSPGQAGKWSEPLQALLAQLEDSGVERALAESLLAEVSGSLGEGAASSRAARDAVMALITRRFGPPQGIQLSDKDRRVVALVGPTGVGKTTTLAKLAAAFALGQKKNVALVTADTYRIAAVEQLRTYGEIIGVPVDVVFSEQELRAALGRHSKRDLVLIDTAGRSPRNTAQMEELASLLAAARPDETHLVLSLTTGHKEAFDAADQFGRVGFDHLLLTKLDECMGPGLALSLAVQIGKPISYVTTGQNVPDDIELCQPEKLAARLLGE